MSDVTDPARVAELEAEVARLRAIIPADMGGPQGCSLRYGHDADCITSGGLTCDVANALPLVPAWKARADLAAARAALAALREAWDRFCAETHPRALAEQWNREGAERSALRHLEAAFDRTLAATPSETVRPAHCPTCGSPDGFWLRAPCAADQFDPDPWHRTRPTPTDPKEA